MHIQMHAHVKACLHMNMRTHTHANQKIILAQTPNSMGRNTWAESLQALLLSNCTLRYLVLMAVAHMTCYQHFICKTSVVHARFEKQTLIGARRSLCRGPGALSVGAPALSLSGPTALCVGPRRSLCRGPALSVSGRRSPSGSASRSSSPLLWGPGGVPLCRGQAALSALSSDTLCRAAAVSVSGLRRSSCRARRPQRGSCSSPHLSSACHPSGPTASRSLFPGENPKPYRLGET